MMLIPGMAENKGSRQCPQGANLFYPQNKLSLCECKILPTAHDSHHATFFYQWLELTFLFSNLTVKAPGKGLLDPAWVTCPVLNYCEESRHLADFPRLDSSNRSNQTIWICPLQEIWLLLTEKRNGLLSRQK